MKVVVLSVLRTGHFYPPGNIPGTYFFYRLSQPQGHSAAGRIISTKNSNDTIGNRTRDLPVFSAVPQPTASHRALSFTIVVLFYNPDDGLLMNRRRCVDAQQLARVLLLHQILTNWDTTAGNTCVDYLHVYSSVRSLHTSQCT